VTTQSTTITTPSNLVEVLVQRTGLSWLRASAAVGLVAILALVGAAYLDGVLARPFNADFWRIGLGSPAIIAHSLLFRPGYRRWRDGAIMAFRSLVPVDDTEFQRSLYEASLINRRRVWVAATVGAGACLLLSRPWDRFGAAWTWSPEGQSAWLTLVGLPMSGMLYGFIGYFVYSALSRPGSSQSCTASLWTSTSSMGSPSNPSLSGAWASRCTLSAA